jgi:hypothetical protein
MIYKNHKLVGKTAKTLPLHLIYLYFHRRAWFSNWQSEINDILLQPTMKANTTCQDCLPTGYTGRIRKWLGLREGILIKREAAHFLKLYHAFPLGFSFARGILYQSGIKCEDHSWRVY